MDDALRLRRTVRRCTAVLVAALGVVAGLVAGPGNALVGVVLVVLALLYLAGSVVLAPLQTATAEDGADGDGATT